MQFDRCYNNTLSQPCYDKNSDVYEVRFWERRLPSGPLQPPAVCRPIAPHLSPLPCRPVVPIGGVHGEESAADHVSHGLPQPLDRLRQHRLRWLPSGSRPAAAPRPSISHVPAVSTSTTGHLLTSAATEYIRAAKPATVE